jgi:hypothetical protein
MRTVLLVIGGLALLAVGSEARAQSVDSSATRRAALPAPPKVKAKTAAGAPAPEPTVARDSTPAPKLPRKTKSAAPARETELPVVTKPPKSPA